MDLYLPASQIVTRRWVVVALKIEVSEQRHTNFFSLPFVRVSESHEKLVGMYFSVASSCSLAVESRCQSGTETIVSVFHFQGSSTPFACPTLGVQRRRRV